MRPHRFPPGWDEERVLLATTKSDDRNYEPFGYDQTDSDTNFSELIAGPAHLRDTSGQLRLPGALRRSPSHSSAVK